MAIYERRAPRATYLLALISTLGLTAFLAYGVFFREVEPGREMPTTFKWVMGAACLVGVFLSGSFAYRMGRNPPMFTMDDEGFSYAQGGVSTGLVRWRDVVELKEEVVLETNRTSKALAVVLRNPEEYIARFPRALRPLFAVRMQQNSSPLMMNIAMFGPDYPRVKALMEEQIRRQPGLK